MILTRGGTNLPLDPRISDALMTYAIQAADAEGIPRQTWIRNRWGLKDYQAKDILKGNATKTLFEQILKRRGPHCGWFVGIAVIGAVAGEELHEFLREQNRMAAKAAELAHEHEQLAKVAYRHLETGAAGAGASRRSWQGAGEVGARQAGRVAR